MREKIKYTISVYCTFSFMVTDTEYSEEEEEQYVSPQTDDTDFRIISLLILGYDSKEVSATLKIPLSTIQRRTRRILISRLVKLEYAPDFKTLGIKKGLLHTYLSNGQLKTIAQKISEMEGVLSASIHVGNSDIVSEFVYQNSEDLVDIIAAIKQIGGVDRVMWSEEVYKLPSHKENVMKSFKKYWGNNHKYRAVKSKNNNGRNFNNNNSSIRI